LAYQQEIQSNRERKDMEGKEKRNHTRQMLVTKVAYRVLMHSKGETLTQNISQGGLCLILDKELPAGATLGLKIDMPGKETRPIEVFAQVIWQKKSEMGYITGLKLSS
jgi:PilZ domain